MNKGFTLIELLVVISIVSLLSSVVMSSLNGARIKARDAQRIMALKEIEHAILLYAADHNGQYPGYLAGEATFVRSQANSTEGECGYGQPGYAGDSPSYNPGIWCKLQNSLAPYIKELPKTGGGKPPYLYMTYKVPSLSLVYNPNGVRMYGLSVVLEQANDASINDGGYYNNWYELGELPAYCKAQSVPSAQIWNGWASNPCSCSVYYTSGCGY